MLFEEPRKRVLVVDDNEDVLRSEMALLELAGFNVSAIASGEDALNEINNQKYDLLILDVAMPGIDGVELFQIARKSEMYRNIPILFTSGFPIWTEPKEQRREIFEKADAYMQKPFNTEMFIETVRTLLKKKTPASNF